MKLKKKDYLCAMVYHNKYETKKKEDYLYVTSMVYGFVGIVIYANPFLLPFTIYKEIYRFEVDVRNLEDEKKTSFYNSLLY
jgi:hypothetical protein